MTDSSSSASFFPLSALSDNSPKSFFSVSSYTLSDAWIRIIFSVCSGSCLLLLTSTPSTWRSCRSTAQRDRGVLVVADAVHGAGTASEKWFISDIFSLMMQWQPTGRSWDTCFCSSKESESQLYMLTSTFLPAFLFSWPLSCCLDRILADFHSSWVSCRKSFTSWMTRRQDRLRGRS